MDTSGISIIRVDVLLKLSLVNGMIKLKSGCRKVARWRLWYRNPVFKVTNLGEIAGKQVPTFWIAVVDFADTLQNFSSCSGPRRDLRHVSRFHQRVCRVFRRHTYLQKLLDNAWVWPVSPKVWNRHEWAGEISPWIHHQGICIMRRNRGKAWRWRALRASM